MGTESAEVLETMGRYIRSLQLMEKEKTAELKVHMLTIYTAFIAFILISVILINSFFYPLQEISSEIGSILIKTISPQTARTYLYHMILIEAVASGLMIGKITENRITAGLKHIIILAITSLIAYNILL